MNYADTNYYKQYYRGTLIPDEEVFRYLMLASRDIDILTFNRSLQFNTLPEYQRDIVTMCTCLQAEHLYTRQDISGLNVSQITVDDSTITYKDNETTRYSRVVRDMLINSGLCYAGFN